MSQRQPSSNKQLGGFGGTNQGSGFGSGNRGNRGRGRGAPGGRGGRGRRGGHGRGTPWPKEPKRNEDPNGLKTLEKWPAQTTSDSASAIQLPNSDESGHDAIYTDYDNAHISDHFCGLSNHTITSSQELVARSKQLPGPLRQSFGKPVDDTQYVLTNHLQITSIPKEVYEYVIDGITLENLTEESKPIQVNAVRERRRLFDQWKVDNKRSELLAHTQWATDYQSIWTLKPLDLNAFDSLKGLQYHRANGDLAIVANLNLEANENNPIKLGEAGNARDLVSNGDDDDTQQKIRIINAFVMKHVTSRADGTIMQQGANKFFLPQNRKYIDNGLVAIRGYFASVKPGNMSMLLNVNCTTSAFFNVPQTVDEYLNCNDGRLGAVQKDLKGTEVRIMYGQEPPEERQRLFAEFSYEPKKKDGSGGWVDSARQTFFDGKFQKVIERSNALLEKIRTDIRESHPEVVDTAPNNHGRPSPCVNVGKAKNRRGKTQWSSTEWYLPRHLEILKGQIYGRAISNDFMINFARLTPCANICHLVQQGIPSMNLGDENSVVQIDQRLIKVPAHVLQRPTVEFALNTDRQSVASLKSDTSWALVKPQMTGLPEESKLPAVPVLSFTSQFSQGGKIVDNFSEALAQNLRQHGILARDSGAESGSGTSKDLLIRPASLTFANSEADSEHDTTTDTRLSSIALHFDDLLRAFRSRYGMAGINDTVFKAHNKGELGSGASSIPNDLPILVILPSKSATDYAAVKRVGDLMCGIKTICTSWEQLKRQSSFGNFCGNLALKYQIKCAGETHSIKELREERALDDCIILGADVTHPGRGAVNGCPSIAAVVGSVGANHMTYPGDIRLQPSRQEIIDDMDEMVKSRILAWVADKARSPSHAPRLPASILFYRDGVADTQYLAIKEIEVERVREGYSRAREEFMKLYPKAQLPDEQAKITFVVVGKRHHARFYPTEESQSHVGGANKGKTKEPFRDGNKTVDVINGNLKPGFVIDRVVTHPLCYDFYLQSHAAVQGTARPAHYFVLENEMDLNPDKLHNITHALTYAFARATKAVSYCAPAYYADKLCDRARHYLRAYLDGDSSVKDDEMFDMTEEEKALMKEDRAEALRIFRKRVVTQLRNHKDWISEERSEVGRQNPWHENMDKIMFYV